MIQQSYNFVHVTTAEGVVARRAKWWPDQIIRIKIIANQIFWRFQLGDRKSFVKWSPNPQPEDLRSRSFIMVSLNDTRLGHWQQMCTGTDWKERQRNKSREEIF